METIAVKPGSKYKYDFLQFAQNRILEMTA